MKWTTACPDWRERIIAGRTLIPFKPLFPDEAAAALDVFKGLRIVDLPGAPRFGEVCEQYVFDFVAAIFGSYNPETGERLIDEFFLLIAKKNVKSTLAAGVMLTALIRNWRPYAELNVIAPTLEIARNSFDPAAGMVRADEQLSRMLHCRDHLKTIEHRETHATLKTLAADSEVVSGKKTASTLVEELWLFGKKPGADKMFQEATGGQISRSEGFSCYISTQSDEPPAGIFASKLAYARKVRDGEIDDPRFLPVLYEFPPEMLDDDSYLDPANFYIPNPNLGRSVNGAWISRKLKQIEIGEGDDGDTWQSFVAKHLNVEIGGRRRNDGWAGASFWEAAAEPGLTLESLLKRCDVATIGIDGGGLDDLLGWAVIGREKETKRWLLWARAWAHPIVLKRRPQIATTLQAFERQGDLIFCREPTQDIREVADLCVKVRDAGLLPEENAIGADRLGLPAIVDELEARGFKTAANGGNVVSVSQGGFLNDAVMGVERKVSDGTMRHGGQPIMLWSVTNAKTVTRGNATSITKEVSGRSKIDPFIATLNAAKLMSLNPQPKRKPQHQMFFVG